MESLPPEPESQPCAVENEAPQANVGVAAVEATPDCADKGDEGSNAGRGRGKKPAWSKPSVIANEAGPVMGAVSWPALSEAVRASVKPSSSELPLSSPSPQVHQISPKKPNSSSLNLNPKSQMAPSRQRSMKRGGDSASSSNSSVSANGVPASMVSEERTEAEPFTKGTTGKNGDHGSRAGGNEHHRSYGGWGRKGGNGGNSYQQNSSNVNRRDNDWNQRGMNGLDGRIQQPMQHRGSRPYLRPLVPVTAPMYISPPPPPPPLPIHGHPFPTLLPDAYSPLYYPHPELGPMIVAPAPLYLPLDPVGPLLLKQIDYYFSSENLCRDAFLRQNMDDQGWVSIYLIAGFKRVKLLTNSIPFILNVVRFSSVVETQDDKIRRRNDWMNWLLPSSNRLTATSPVPNRVDAGALGAQAPAVKDMGVDSNEHMAGRFR